MKQAFRAKHSTATLPDDAILVLQVTDTHISQDPDGRLLGVNTRDSLREVLRFSIAELPRKPDLLVMTGDVVHDGTKEAYRTVGRMISKLGIPAHLIPGNHDVMENMQCLQEFPTISLGGQVDLGNWRLVLLDSVKPGCEGGALSADELTRLEHGLAGSNRHCLVALHHHPIPIGSAWLDTMGLENSHELLPLLRAHPQVRVVLFGHVHQASYQERDGIAFISSPSTCVQFMPNQDDFQVDSLSPPAARMLALCPDGRVESALLKLSQMPKGIELRAAGY